MDQLPACTTSLGRGKGAALCYRDLERLFQAESRVPWVLNFEANKLLLSYSSISTSVWRPRFPGNKRTKVKGEGMMGTLLPGSDSPVSKARSSGQRGWQGRPGEQSKLAFDGPMSVVGCQGVRGRAGWGRAWGAVARAPTRTRQSILADKPYHLVGMALGRTSSGSVPRREHWPSSQVHGSQNQEKWTHAVQALI